MASEFIEGPWTVMAKIFVDDVEGMTVCVPNALTPEGRVARTHLIAAAPELLEALKYMYDSARELSCECFELGAIQAAKEAIAKAEGTHV